MAFNFPSHNLFIKRYGALPESLRDAVDSTQIKKTMESIGREHYLDTEKQQILEALVGFVLLGFLAKSELVHEISERLFLNHEHSRALANDINNRIFDSVKEEIDEIYNPNEEEPVEEEEVQPIKEGLIATEDEGERIRVSAAETEVIAPISLSISGEGDGPVVLQKGGSFFEKSEGVQPKKRSFIPLNMFASSPESNNAKPAIKVKIETPQTFSWPFEKKKPQEKVVHYTESRSSASSELENAEGLIHLEALQNIPPKEQASPQIAVAPQNEFAKENSSWSIKSMFGKSDNTEKPIATVETKPIIDSNPAIDIKAQITINQSIKPEAQLAPVAPSPKSTVQEILTEKMGPMLEGNIVHLK